MQIFFDKLSNDKNRRANLLYGRKCMKVKCPRALKCLEDLVENSLSLDLIHFLVQNFVANYLSVALLKVEKYL